MNKKMPTPTKWLIIICSFLVITLIFLFHFKVVNPSKSFQDIILGLAIGFTLWLSTQTLLIWINNSDKIELNKAINSIKSFHNDKDKIDNAISTFESFYNEYTSFTTDTFKQHDGTINKVLNVVQQKYLSLIEESRENLDKKFYEKLYCNVRQARVSGLALTEFLKSLLEENHPIIQSLKRNNGVAIRALIADPNSEYVVHRDVVEESKKGTKCSKVINDNINDLIGKIIEKYKNLGLPNGNRLIIRASRVPINLAITHVKKNEAHGKKELLYMGFVFHHDLGNKMPIYKVPTANEGIENSIYKGCRDNFDEAFDYSRQNTCLIWDENGARKK